MYSRHLTPPSTSAYLDPQSARSRASSAASSSGYLSRDSSPNTVITTPARSPIRQHGPLLLPKIRSQDQTTEPTGPAGGPVRHRRTASSASNGYQVTYNPYARPGVTRRSTSPPESNSSVCSPASMFSPYDAGCSSGLDSPISFTPSKRPSLAPHSRSHSAHTASSHSRSTSASSVDESIVRRYGYPTSRAMPSYTTAASIPGYNASMQTAYANGFDASQVYENQYASVPPAVQHPLASELQYDSFDDMTSTTTLLDFLTAPNPSPALVRRVTSASHSQDSYFWWDIRNLRSWTDFTIETISSIPGLMPLLGIPVSSSLLPTPPRPNLNPDCEAALHDICSQYHSAKLNAALAVAQGPSHISMKSRRGAPTAQTPCDFISNYATDYEKTIYGESRGRVVGIVKSYDQWNTMMRGQEPPQQVYYLQGLAHLHRVMREHGCRYGFIMTEIELLCVRCGGPDDAAAANQANATTTTVNADAQVPLFGYLELSAPISISTHGFARGGSADADGVAPQITAGLALWFLHMLAKEEALPGIGGSWRMDVGGPAALTRQHCWERDAWMPRVEQGEKRVAKRVRGWVWPEEGLSRKECGRGRR
ncbi:hypothetical protein K490DRAFT_21661, partial [Saccharata proteae CBS 121410]